MDRLSSLAAALPLLYTLVLLEYSISMFLLLTSRDRDDFDSFSLLGNLFVGVMARFSDNASRGRIVTVPNTPRASSALFTSKEPND